MKLTERTRTAVTLSAFAVLFLALTAGSFVRESATWDEPQHLTAGYQALAKGDCRVDPEHPPLLRMWAAVPLWLSGVSADDLPDLRGEQWLMLHQFVYCHQFLYRNNADQLLNRARFMNALWGVLLGGLIFFWMSERFGYWPAVGGLALYTVEPNILAHAGLVTTDFGVTCLIAGTLYFLWRAVRQPTFANFAGLTVFFALAQISKFTAVLLVPLVVALLVVAVVRQQLRWRTALLACGALAVTTYLAIWAAYSFRFLPSPTGTETLGVQSMEMVQARKPGLAKTIRWVADHKLLPSAYLEGFLLGQTKAQARSAYLAGNFSTEGWWYFFPVAFLIKTPAALLVLFFAGLAFAAWRWRESWPDDLYWLLPMAVFMGMAMFAKLNIGVRHVLPIYPFVILFAAKAIHELWQRRRKELAAIAVGVAAVELAFVYPHPLAFFNFAVGGPKHGHDYLVDSNLDWGQDLKGLKQWMLARNVQHINLSYFGTASAGYYGIDCTHLPGAPFFEQVQAPRLPGYVAVSVTNLRGVYLSEAGRNFYRPLLESEPVDTIGYSINIYWRERPWW